MHIPEGMLSGPVTAVTGLGAAGTVGYAVAWIRKHMDQRKVVLMAVLGALIFALQMLNFPVQAGTSGHFAGGALAGIILGPWPAAVVLTAVLAVQALLFADGGVIALGANVLNLGIVAPFLGYAVYNAIAKLIDSKAGRVGGSFVAAWLSIVVAAGAVAIQLGLSGTANFGVAMVAMVGTHALIGVGEGLITAALVSYLLVVRPDLLKGDISSTGTKPMRSVIVTLAAVAVLAAGFSFVASSFPDGLEFVYFEQGVGDVAAVETAPSLVGDGGPLADYGVAGMDNEALGSAIAGVVGLTVTAGVLAAVAIRKRRTAATPEEA